MIRILVVDDNTDVCTALELLLSIHGYHVHCAANQQQAKSALGQHSFQLVIQDMNFSAGNVTGEEGKDLFLWLKAHYPKLPVILITAWAKLQMAIELTQKGAFDYIEKPWNDRHLLAKVAAVLDGHQASQCQTMPQDLIYASPITEQLIERAQKVAVTDASTLITGANGAGKEKIAELIHQSSKRADQPFVKINMGAIPHDLMEAELFGAVSGAFTGAKARKGRFSAAHCGTLFLDEIGNLSLQGQMKLLRVLQSGEFERVGSDVTEKVDVRLLSATNSCLTSAIAQGQFRQDLYYRINVIELHVPPLKDRLEDIIPLIRYFLQQNGGQHLLIPPETEQQLIHYAWPGNVRELSNACQRAVIFATATQLSIADFGIDKAAISNSQLSPASELLQVLEQHNWVVSRAADSLQLSRQALYRKMQRYNIQKPS